MLGGTSGKENGEPVYGDEDTDEQREQSPPQIFQSASEPDHPPSPSHQKKSHKPDRDWLDYVKFAVEVLGLTFLILYTVYAGLQWCEFRRANNIAQRSLTLTKELATTGQAAFFRCQIYLRGDRGDPIPIPRVTVNCINEGHSIATNFIGEIAFSRDRPTYAERRPVKRPVVGPGDTISETIAVGEPWNLQRFYQQNFRVNFTMRYNNGISVVPDSMCRVLFGETSGYAWDTCDSAKAYQHGNGPN